MRTNSCYNDDNLTTYNNIQINFNREEKEEKNWLESDDSICGAEKIQRPTV